MRGPASPDLREQLIKPGGEPMSMTPDEFSKFVRSEMDAASGSSKSRGSSRSSGRSTLGLGCRPQATLRPAILQV